MSTFYWVSGQLTEVQRFINVPMRWCEQYPARERRELWITDSQGEETKLVVHTRCMPARRGHQVLAVLHRMRPVGLRNLSTGDQVNFVRSDPPLLWRRCDGLAVALLAVATAAAALAGWPWLALVALPAVVTYAPALVVARSLLRWKLAREVDGALDAAVRQATSQPALRRVK